jgi:hypothetical protein
MLSRSVPATCTVLILVCRKTCCTIAAYRYTCTYNILYSLSYIRKQCDDRLWVSLNFFPLHSFSSQEQESYSPALIFECGCHDDGDSKNFSNACARISVHLTSTSWKQSSQWLLQTFQIMLLIMIFCIDLLLFYTSNIMNFISLVGGFIYWMVYL